MTAVEIVAVAVRFVGLVLVLPGLWLVANGMRVVVSGRIDERRRAGSSLRRGVPILLAGLLFLFGASWIHAWAQ